MPAYARASGFADHRRHPRALMLIVGGHAVLVAAVMTARMDIGPTFDPTTTVIDFIDPPKPPPPEPPKPTPEAKTQAKPRNSQVDQPDIVIPVLSHGDTTFDDTPLPPLPNPGPIGTGTEFVPTPIPKPDRVLVGPRLATPERLLKPTYPVDKQRLEEEAVLRLKLSIDERGRVVAVEPVGRVDRSFFEAARKHLLAYWRYKPATEDGRAVASSTVITLTFRLET